MPNYYLVGMMGSGKTVTARALSKLLNCESIDLDQKIEEKHKSKIADIFESKGEIFFRSEESLVLKTIPQNQSNVIATGGGVILNEENVRWMKKTGKLIYLETSFEVLWQRVQGKKHRPLINQGNPEETLKQILADRKRKYEAASDWKVTTDYKTAEQVADEIFEWIKKNEKNHS